MTSNKTQSETFLKERYATLETMLQKHDLLDGLTGADKSSIEDILCRGYWDGCTLKDFSNLFADAGDANLESYFERTEIINALDKIEHSSEWHIENCDKL